jgi:hypothetical protein
MGPDQIHNIVDMSFNKEDDFLLNVSASCCDQELAPTLDSRLLQESSLPGALYRQKLCPGFWPIC